VVWATTRPTISLEADILEAFPVGITAKKTYECQNAKKKIFKIEIKQTLEKQNYTNRILKLTQVKFNQTTIHLLEA
jgi:hypothetical protein